MSNILSPAILYIRLEWFGQPRWVKLLFANGLPVPSSLVAPFIPLTTNPKPQAVDFAPIQGHILGAELPLEALTAIMTIGKKGQSEVIFGFEKLLKLTVHRSRGPKSKMWLVQLNWGGKTPNIISAPPLRISSSSVITNQKVAKKPKISETRNIISTSQPRISLSPVEMAKRLDLSRHALYPVNMYLDLDEDIPEPEAYEVWTVAYPDYSKPNGWRIVTTRSIRSTRFVTGLGMEKN